MRSISIIILLSLTFISPLFSDNLLLNPGMEENDSEPVGWRLDEFQRGGTIVKIEHDAPFGGKNYVSLENTIVNDARLTQTVKVEENTNYKISGWIKTENVSAEGIGANLSLNEHWFISREFKGTNEKWEYAEFFLRVTENLGTVTVCLRLGGYGGTSTGKAFFDDISMEKVQEVPEGQYTFSIGRTKKDDSKKQEVTHNEETAAVTEAEYTPPVDRTEVISNIIVYVLVFLSIVIFCIQLIIIKPAKRENPEG